MKIDLTKIEGYSKMTADEKLAALEQLEIPEQSYDGWIRKETFDKTASELAQYKRQLKERMSEDEVQKAKETEEREMLVAELESLRKERAIDQHTARFLSLGYEKKLAQDTAKAMVAGDFDRVFANQEKAKEQFEKALRAQLLDSMGSPERSGDGKSQTITQEQFATMGYSEREALFRENPDLYHELNQ